MVEEIAIAPVSSLSYYSPFIFILILIGFFIYGVFLLIKSKNIDSKQLKIGIYIPLVINILFILFYISIFLVRFILEKDVFGMVFLIVLVSPLIAISLIISSIYSIISFRKSEEKIIPFLTLCYSLIPLIFFSIIAVWLILGMPGFSM